MAGPVTHIVLALLIMPFLPEHIDKEAFIVGTSFPDIRYIVAIDRKQTHLEPVSWNNIINEPSSFRAGMKFHNLVDILRIHYFENIYIGLLQQKGFNLKEQNFVCRKLFPSIMKGAEDYLLYTKIHDWPQITKLFDKIYEEEKEIVHDEIFVQKWHNIIKEYSALHPGIESIERLGEEIGLKMKLAFKIVPLWVDNKKLFNNFVEDPLFQATLENFYNTFLQIIQCDKEFDSSFNEFELAYVPS